ncbi:MAG: carboxylating nicotinate-nucleotide diphosphorylase [Saprospiraceae bacterium]|nr:carboxylating nicotinate-nucleotide diphosphorylase [Saprospiraceae bacterium]
MFEDHIIENFIVAALAEDVGSGDHTSNACINAESISTARLLVKDCGVIAGIALAERIFKHVDPAAEIDVKIRDGAEIDCGDVAFYVTCNTRALLKAERLVLNSMQRMSGIATLSSRFAVEVEGLPVKILDTRKTTPLIRFMEKWAVHIGGCTNYRNGLYDWIMIKDNHVDACGSHAKAIAQVHQYLKANQLDLGITVEVRNLVELHEVLEAGGITRIMLDNFEIPLLKEAVATIQGRFETEASGGITLQNVRSYAETGVDFISVGALTHSSGTLDLSLKVI